MSWFVAGTSLLARLDLAVEVHVSTGGRTGFSGCSVDFVVALCGYQRLANVVGGHCTAVVCGKLCGSAAKEGDGKMLSTGVVRYVSSARYGSCPEASAFPRRFFTVWTDRSTKPLLCGYSGELVTWSMPHCLQKAANS